MSLLWCGRRAFPQSLALFFYAAAMIWLTASFSSNCIAQTEQVQHELNVRVQLDRNDAPAPAHLSVQLFNQAGALVNDRLTDDHGQVFFGAVAAGNYHLKVSGKGIEDSSAPYAFNIDPHEMSHTEYVHVRSTPNQAPAGTAAISVTSMRVPDAARKEYNKGASDFSSQSFASAEKHFLKAVELYPEYSAAFNSLGALAMKNNNSGAALAWFQKAISSDDQNAGAYVNLGKLYANEHQLVEMESSLARAVLLEPSNAEALSLLANAQLALGKPQDALVNARKVHGLPHERFSFTHIIAAKALEAQGMPQEAIAEYRTYLKEAPPGPKSDQVREAIKKLNK